MRNKRKFKVEHDEERDWDIDFWVGNAGLGVMGVDGVVSGGPRHRHQQS